MCFRFIITSEKQKTIQIRYTSPKTKYAPERERERERYIYIWSSNCMSGTVRVYIHVLSCVHAVENVHRFTQPICGCNVRATLLFICIVK